MSGPVGSSQWMYKSEDFTLDQSLKSSRAGPNNLSRTPTAGGNRQKWVFSCWVKRSQVSGNTEAIFTTPGDYIIFNSNSKLNWSFNTESDGNLVTTQVFRDAGAWMHLLFVHDTTQATASNRALIYVNGVRITAFDTATYPAEDRNGNFNHTNEHNLIEYQAYNEHGLNGYIAEVHFIDRDGSGSEWFTNNSGATNSSFNINTFGETGTYGEWKPKEVSGVTYGTNGFYLPFKSDYEVEGFSAVTWKGNGATQYIGGTGFQPDLVWLKDKDATESHRLFDSVRGIQKNLASINNSAEWVDAYTLNSFDTDGFTLFSENAVNKSGDNYVAWNWDMGTNSPTGFSAVNYTGAGGSQSFGGVGFSPDLVWIKSKATGTDHHQLYDTVRGATLALRSSGPEADETIATGLSKFDPDGFTVAGHQYTNRNTSLYIAWCWNMGGTTATNTSGSITSTVMANTTYGQSIVSYTGTGSAATIGHGLSAAPKMILVKNRDAADAWRVYHDGISNDPETDFLCLNTTAAAGDDAGVWNDTAPTSSVFSVATESRTNENTEKFIAYCFHDVTGYSKIASYTGNGSATGPTVTTGFRPAFLLIKKDADEGWQIIDSTRNPLNTATASLSPNSSSAERTDLVDVDFLDTGFQLKGTDGSINSNGSTYVYYAVAGGSDAVSTYNTTGSTDSRVKANPTYGQSVVSWTGTGSDTTIGHGLSGAPEFIIVKNRDTASTDWAVMHLSSYGGGEGYKAIIKLNTNAAYSTTNGSDYWNNTAPTSSVFTVGTHDITNKSGDSMIAYCFDSVSGYSKFGHYFGNGQSTGNTTTIGFRPAVLIVKKTNVAEDWYIFDSTRQAGTNEFSHWLELNNTTIEDTAGTSGKFTITDTGFTPSTSNGSVNTNGSTYMYMAFADTREYAYWLDQSGNNNDWTSNNLTESDISVDSPTNNFCTMNPLDRSIDNPTELSEGNLKCVQDYVSDARTVRGTFAPTTGKWYFECLIAEAGTWSHGDVGILNVEDDIDRNNVHLYNTGWWHENSGQTFNGSSAENTSLSAVGGGDIVQVAYDLDASKIWFGRNNTWILSGNPATAANPTYSNLSGTLAPACDMMNSNSNGTFIFNFGQDSSFAGNKTAQGNQDSNDIGDFYYEPPTDFLALCTSNLAAVAVTPSEHFGVQLYSHTNADQTVTLDDASSLDMVWVKSRSQTQNHRLIDIIRGKSLSPNATSSESNDAGSYAFSGNTFTIDNNTGDANENSATYVAWMWKANGSGSSNTNGTINTTSTSANTDAGFSISTYTGNATSGATVGHGLSKAPEMIFIKPRSQNSGWFVYHSGNTSAPETEELNLEVTEATQDVANIWNDTAPTSTVFSLGNNAGVNGNTYTFVAYCFHSVEGFSKVGSYTGNGNADGTFIYTGFRPAFIIQKPASRTGHWMMTDKERTPSNVVNKVIFANASSPEYTNPTAAVQIDFLSNGFKQRLTDDNSNENNATYIYLAFAETPFKHANAR